MKERLQKLLPWIAYPAFYFVCLFLFGVLTFPYDKLRERIVVSYNAQQREKAGQQELVIGAMSSWWLTGVKMTDVRLVSPGTEPGKLTELRIDEARVRVSLYGLLLGRKNVTFSLTAFGGKIDGDLEEGKDRRIEVHLRDINLGDVEPITHALGLPMEGHMEGTIELVFPEGKASKGTGALNLELTDVAVGDGKAKVKTPLGPLGLPKLTVGTLLVVAEAKDGLFKVTKFAATGKDLDLQGEGKIQLRDITSESGLDIMIRFKVNDSYRNKSEVAKSLFGAPGSTAPPIMSIGRRPDGFYGWTVRGALGHLDFQPAAGGAPLR